MERERGAGEAAFRVLFEHGSDPAVVLERGAVVDANPLALRALAYARGELVGLSTRALFVEPEALAELRAALHEHGLVHARALALRRGDGARLDALVTAARLAEAPARWIVIVRPRVAVEPQAPAGAGLLEAIIENTSAVIYVKDLEGRVLLVNRRYETALGLRRA
ncbi:MAG: PAS domain S-box protein, partial [Myxococcales bacterium]|nr:PAS domain S-box protein [Myxococcales bacterium]